MDEKQIKDWMMMRIDGFIYSADNKDIKDLSNRLRAIADEAELRLSNPKWPESND